jgi:hypothetical protein
MTTLYVHLREGFTGEPVTVRIDGQLRLDSAPIRTRMQVGLAKVLEVDVPRGAVEVEVSLPSRDIAHRVSVPVDDAPVHVGITMDDDGALSHVVSDHAFRYA